MLHGLRYRFTALRRVFRIDDADEYIYIFNHIPKSGGTAVRHVLGEWHAIVADYRKGISEDETRQHVEAALDLKKIRRPAIVCGHYGLAGTRLHERYPQIFENPRYRLIVFVRDPLETAISSFFYAQKIGQPVVAPDIDTYLTHYRGNIAQILNCAEENYAGALRQYWFVGVTERLTESMRLLSRMLGKPYIEPPRLNLTSRMQTPTQDAVAAFRRNNEIDFEIYNAACRRLQRDLASSS